MEDTKKSKSVFKACIIFVLIVFTVFIASRYLIDEEFRSYVDVNILKKELSEVNVNTIELNSDTNEYVYAYDKYITVLSKNSLNSYIGNGSLDSKIDVNISVPLVESSGKYMVLAEKNGNKIYLISGQNIIWEKDIEGEISRVCVNKNGYVSAILKNTTYKSVIIVINPEGRDLFKSFLSTNYAVCMDISNNNKYLAVGEINYSGTIVKSYVKIMSIEKAQKDPENSIEYTYESGTSEIITNINYQNREEAICLFNNYIQKVTTKDNSRVYDIGANDVFAEINLDSNVAIINKQSSGLFSYEYKIDIKSPDSKTESLYILKNDVPKTIMASSNIMAVCLANEVEFINTNGWLIKRYTSNKQSKGIVLGDTIAGIIYKNKVEIINL
ncbi:MAG: hypothetical protein HFJ46_07815 [Clostridia bacterium]|nr:hypothetical protein [Clostridia bacterium]